VMEVTGKGRACIPKHLDKQSMFEKQKKKNP